MMGRRTRLVVGSLVAAAMFVVACGEDGTGPADTVLSVTITPATDSVDIGSSIQLQAGARSGSGATVSALFTWSSSDGSVATVSSSGLVTGVSEGVAAITASANGRTGESSVTVLDPRTEAILAAREIYVDSVAEDFFVLALVSRDPLPAGTEIVTSAPPAASPPVTTLERDAFFVLVDLVPTGGLPHPFTYLLVDAEDRSVVLESSFQPPVIDGVAWYATFDERRESSDRFEPAILQEPLKPVRGVVYEFNEDPFAGEPGAPPPARTRARDLSGVSRAPLLATSARSITGQRVAVVLNAGRDAYLENTADLMGAFFTGAGFATTRLDSKDFSLTAIRNEIRSIGDDLGPGDKFVLYIVSHSWSEDDDKDGVLDGPVNNLGYDAGGSNEASWTVATTGNGSVADLLNDISAERVNLLIETCGAGTLVRRLTQPLVGEPFEAPLGTTVKVYAGSAYDRVCYFSFSPVSPEAQAGRYSSLILDYFEENPLDANDDGELELGEIESGFDAAHEHAITAFATGDAFDQKPPPPVTFSNPLVTLSGPASISFVHVLGETQCFQPIGSTITITNQSEHTVSWSSAELGGPFDRIKVEPFSGVLARTGQPGSTIEVNLKFLCNWTMDFTTTLEFLFTTEDESTQARQAIEIVGDIIAGSLTVTTSTSGEDQADAYEVEDVGRGTLIGTIGPNETKEFSGVRTGTYQIRLKPIREGEGADNCTSQDGLLRDVTVPANGGTTVTFEVTCAEVMEPLIGHLRTPVGEGTTVRLIDVVDFTTVWEWPVPDGVVFRSMTGMPDGTLLVAQTDMGDWSMTVRDPADGLVLREFYQGDEALFVEPQACGEDICLINRTRPGANPEVWSYEVVTWATDLVGEGQGGVAFSPGPGLEDVEVFRGPQDVFMVRNPAGTGVATPIQGMPGNLSNAAFCPGGETVLFTIWPDGTPAIQNVLIMNFDLSTATASNARNLTTDGASSGPICFAGGQNPEAAYNNSSGFSFKINKANTDGSLEPAASEAGVFNSGAFYYSGYIPEWEASPPSAPRGRGSGHGHPAGGLN